MSDNTIKDNNTKDFEELEKKAQEEFVEFSYKKRMYVFEIISEKNMLGKLDNIGVLINNKLVEIGNMFSSRGVNFYSQSILRPLIENRLGKYYKEACIELLNGIVFDDVMDIAPTGYLDNKLTVLYDIEIETSYHKYKQYCQNVLNYNIQSYMLADIIDDILNSTCSKEAIQKYISYKNELKELKYDKLVNVLDNSILKCIEKKLEYKKEDTERGI